MAKKVYDKDKRLKFSIEELNGKGFKALASLLWASQSIDQEYINKLDQPPPCLVDASLGNHSYIKLKGTKLHYVESGDVNKPLIVLLHGFPDCWIGWRKQISILSIKFRVVALDLKGFGESDKPQWRGNYGVRLQLKELRGFLSAMNVHKCILIGHDLGGQLAWYFAARYPHLVSKLIVVSSLHPNVFWESITGDGDAYCRLLSICMIPWLPEFEAKKQIFLNQIFKHTSSDNLQAYRYTLSRTIDWTGAIHQLRSLSRHRLNINIKLQMPTLLICGTTDTMFPIQAAVKSTEFLDDGQLRLITSGHFPHQENAKEFNRTLLKFLNVEEINVKKDNNDNQESRGFLENIVKNSVKYAKTASYLSTVWKPQVIKL